MGGAPKNDFMETLSKVATVTDGKNGMQAPSFQWRVARACGIVCGLISESHMKNQKPVLMDGYRTHQNHNNPKLTAQRRWGYPLDMTRWIHEDTARRVAASRKLFPWKFFRGDCHSHTQHSDGIGTVAETAAMVKAAGLDFQFVTDHWGITQAPECRKHGLWVGQEPLTQHHHLGILGLDHAYTPTQDLYFDTAEVQRRGGTFFIPHPAGWQPVMRYTEEQMRALETLSDPFLMEIVNGANNIVSAWDETDDKSIVLWDQLLALGKIVHAMGNTDAHAPHAIGMVWNGVFASRHDQKSILRALTEGRSFASDGPLVNLKLGRAEMGQQASAADRKRALQLTAVDSRGLACVAVVADAKELARWNLKKETKLQKSLRLPKSVRRYVRIEARAVDGRRAYSNPIYLP
jgi:hypothetical protein